MDTFVREAAEKELMQIEQQLEQLNQRASDLRRELARDWMHTAKIGRVMCDE